MRVPNYIPGLSTDKQLEQVYQYLQGLNAALRPANRFGWPMDCPLLLAQATSAPGASAIPAFVNATGLYQQVALSWDLDPNPGILDYEIARATSSGGALTIIGHTQGNCFLDTGLADSTSYFYKIQARLLDGSTYSGLSTEDSATTLANDTLADAQLALALRLLYCNTDPRYVLMQFHSGAGTVAAGSSVFLGRDQNAASPPVRFLTPMTMVAVGMWTQASVAPGGADTFSYTLRSDAVNTALTFSTTTAQGAINGAVPVPTGSGLSIRLVTSATAAAANHMVTLQLRVFG